MKKSMDNYDWEWTERDEQIAGVRGHKLPHTQECCGDVAKIPFWEAYRIWIESKLKKVEEKFIAKFKNKSIF